MNSITKTRTAIFTLQKFSQFLFPQAYSILCKINWFVSLFFFSPVYIPLRHPGQIIWSKLLFTSMHNIHPLNRCECQPWNKTFSFLIIYLHVTVTHNTNSWPKPVQPVNATISTQIPHHQCRGRQVKTIKQTNEHS